MVRREGGREGRMDRRREGKWRERGRASNSNMLFVRMSRSWCVDLGAVGCSVCGVAGGDVDGVFVACDGLVAMSRQLNRIKLLILHIRPIHRSFP